MRVGLELLELARSQRARSIFVVGTGRDVGKTTTLRAIYAAACERKLRAGVASIGREGDTLRNDLQRKPRLWLQPQTLFVTARGALPRTPASEVLAISSLQSPAGTLLYARVASSAFYELVGPPTASGVREVVDQLALHSEIVTIDGAVDRIAALAGTDGAIVVAGGAATANTMPEAVDEIAALVARLRTPAFDPQAPAIHIDGALLAGRVAALIADGETRQIVVRDPTQIGLSGRPALAALARLRIRCLRPLRVIATTVASIGPNRAFEPRAFAGAVAAATGLPAFDVFTGTRTA
ncbi:MAG: DUF1611 domain-containing protein [Candidatus Cybelea sp.]